MTHTSSIGPQWPPEKASYGRVKGIDSRGCINSSARLSELLATLEELERSLEPLVVDRISIRALIADQVLAEHGDMLSPWGEALIPLNGCGNELEGLSLLYLGRNADSRSVHPEDLERSLGNVSKAEQLRPRPASSMVARAKKGGYRVRILDPEERRSDPVLQREMAGLYSRFGWSPEDTLEILANPAGLIAVAEMDGIPVSAGIAELSHTVFDDGLQLRMAEFTEAATRNRHRGKGLYSAIVAVLSAELERRSRAGQILGGELNVAFGECSGHDVGVLIAAKRLGRSFSRSECRRRGLSFAGFLPQHVPIAGAPRATPYNDLFPTYLSRDSLYRFVTG